MDRRHDRGASSAYDITPTPIEAPTEAGRAVPYSAADGVGVSGVHAMLASGGNQAMVQLATGRGEASGAPGKPSAEAHEKIGNVHQASLLTRNSPGDVDGSGGGGASRPTDIDCMMVMPRNFEESMALMTTSPATSGGVSPCAGAHIRERFGPPRPVAGSFEDADFRTHTAAQAAASLTTGSNAERFTVGNGGNFNDFHGGWGFTSRGILTDVTPAAWRRGVSWEFTQIYSGDGHDIARFDVRRTIDGNNMTVQKRKLSGGSGS